MKKQGTMIHRCDGSKDETEDDCYSIINLLWLSDISEIIER